MYHFSADFARFPSTRLRRLRGHATLRRLVRETTLSIDDLVLPLFIHHGHDIYRPIASMPGHFQISVDQLKPVITEITELGIPAVILFGIPADKDAQGSDSLDDNGVIQTAIGVIKDLAPELLIISDVCFCEYTDHGHCGIVNDKTGKLDIDNDATLPLLAAQAISHANAGADIVAPSGCIDGMVAHIRQGLDQEGFENIPILSYAVKYSSALYGPFREAADGAPQFGDRSSYQMDSANQAEALCEASLDIGEGADMLMVKPAGAYQDIIYQVKQRFPEIPLGAYHVSGEYAMIKAAAQQDWIDEARVVMEVLTGIKRAGANFIINYYAKEVARFLLTEQWEAP